MNVIYHYYPKFRQKIFDSLRNDAPVPFAFIYGGNSRFGVKSIIDDRDVVTHNFFIKNLVVQTLNFGILRAVCTESSIILGDLKFLNSWLYAILARLFGQKVFFWTHGVLTREGGFKWRLRKAYYSLANALLVYSQHEADLLAELGFTKPIFVIGNSNYSSDDIEAIRLDTKHGTASTGVCYIGRISQNKGFGEFVLLARQNPEIKVTLIGPRTTAQSDVDKTPDNLSVLPSAYDEQELSLLTKGLENFVMFSSAGLSLFTAALLGKRIFLKRSHPQKPEYHLLKEHGLIQEFDHTEELASELSEPALSDEAYNTARSAFLEENTSENVARRILAATVNMC